MVAFSLAPACVWCRFLRNLSILEVEGTSDILLSFPLDLEMRLRPREKKEHIDFCLKFQNLL